jgi:hypothetical protein
MQSRVSVDLFVVLLAGYHAAIDYKQRLCSQVRSFESRLPTSNASFCKGELLMIIGTLMLGLGYIVLPFTAFPVSARESYVQITGGASQA